STQLSKIRRRPPDGVSKTDTLNRDLDLDFHRRLPLLPEPFFTALRILLEPAIELSSIKATRPESLVVLQPINCFFESINVPESVPNSLVTLRSRTRPTKTGQAAPR